GVWRGSHRPESLAAVCALADRGRSRLQVGDEERALPAVAQHTGPRVDQIRIPAAEVGADEPTLGECLRVIARYPVADSRCLIDPAWDALGADDEHVAKRIGGDPWLSAGGRI